MRHISPELFASPERRYPFFDAEHIAQRYGAAEVALQLEEPRAHIHAAARSVRQDDRPAGRMTLLAAE